MSKRGGNRKGAGRPQGSTKVDGVHVNLWLLVELARDVQSRSDRRSVRDGCEKVRKNFGDLGIAVKFGTIRRHYNEADKVLSEPTMLAAEAQEVLNKIRKRREAVGWNTEQLKLLGWTRDDMLRLLPPDAELRVRRALLKHGQDKINKLQAKLMPWRRSVPGFWIV
jgi:hypothetical protein